MKQTSVDIHLQEDRINVSPVKDVSTVSCYGIKPKGAGAHA